MTNTIFSTVDRLGRRFKLMDTLVNNIASRFLPQNEAAAVAACVSGTYNCGQVCTDDYCRPTSDLHTAMLCGCCDSNNRFSYAFLCECDVCY
ncbi:hypothetical protein [Reticulibacter mediterranei]|uniref:hypothetical protein n=1 Tax=Reticulibacter mediterranei TaxID=2778369 RepID=UPI001C689377|nr:hypothetical protein [Reticulibacter mediterranei]